MGGAPAHAYYINIDRSNHDKIDLPVKSE